MAGIVFFIVIYIAAAFALFFRIRLLGHSETREKQFQVRRHRWLRRRFFYLAVCGVVFAALLSGIGCLMEESAANGGAFTMFVAAALFVMLLISVYYLLELSGKTMLVFLGTLLLWVGIFNTFNLLGNMADWAFGMKRPLPVILAEAALLTVFNGIYARIFLKKDLTED